MGAHPPLRLLVVCAWLAAAPAAAYDIAEGVDVGGYFQVWATLLEQMEASGGIIQQPSGDEGSDTTTGFSLHHARLEADISLFDGFFGLRLQLKLERNVEPLDAYVRLTPWRWLSFQLGQMKTPTTWENVASDRTLDFPLRTRLSSAIGDYSLSRTWYTAAQLAGNRSQLRDLGLGISGEVDLGPVPLRYRLMVSNGLGANLWIGGDSSRQYMVTNAPDFFYGARLELEPWAGVITLGGHFTYNKHDDMVLGGGGRVVLDLYRMSWSGDVRVVVPHVGVRLAGMYGGGAILEDYYADEKDDLGYSGWEARAVWRVTDLCGWLADWAWTSTHALEVAFRYEGLETDVDESGAPTRREDFTFGVNYLWEDYARVQLDYVLRRTTDRTEPDLRDDLLVLSVQGAI